MWNRTSSRTSARADAEPSWLRPRALRIRWKRSIRELVGGDPRPRIADLEEHVVAAPPERDRDLARERELERVRDEVEDDLLPHLAIPSDVDALRERRAVHHEAEPRLLHGRAERARPPRSAPGDVERLVDHLHPGVLDPGEVEQAVHELEEPPRIAARELDELALLKPVRPPSAPVRSSSSGQSMSVSGVRNSWLTFKKNFVLSLPSWLSCSFRQRSCSFARWISCAWRKTSAWPAPPASSAPPCAGPARARAASGGRTR